MQSFTTDPSGGSLDPRAPEAIHRRHFVKQLAAAGLATLAAGEPRAHASSISQPTPTADACIVLWMAGGMAAPETFDPKRYAPFEKGMEVKRVLSTFPAIETPVDGLQVCQGLERIASVMDRATLIRSAIQPDLGSILHSRHQYHWHTGYIPPQTVACPHIGSWIARCAEPNSPVMPGFINIGQRLEGVGEKEELKAFTTAGFFGSEYGPMNLPYPEQAASAVQPPRGMTPGRFSDRNKFFRQLVDRSPRREYLSDYQRESLMRSMDKAYRLLDAPERQAFDIDQEPQESREAYDTGRFGRGCLLARRLVESGAKFVEVTTEYVPFLHWDTHAEGHQTTKRLHAEIDRPVAQLILDLEARGLLDRTLVVLASEFSRDALIEGQPGSSARDQARHQVDRLTEMKHYGLHRHFTGGTSVVMFGGGVKQGFVYGRTADERPLLAVENPVTVTDLHATIMRAMGISPQSVFYIEGRPFFVTKDGLGKPVDAVFA
jgi:hypothetical protein